MRKLIPLAFFLLFLPTIHAQERAVSNVVRTGAVGDQSAPRVATNGTIALAAWIDTRDNGSALFAARIDASGNVLDPTGVRLATLGTIDAVVWNGETFVVASGPEWFFVTPEMVVTEKRVNVVGHDFAAVTPGPDVRFLYFSLITASGTVAVVDGHGDVVARKPVWSSGTVRAAGASANGFLLLRRDGVAVRTDRDGNVLSSKPSLLPEVNDAVISIAGGDDGFLLTYARHGAAAFLLDTDGVSTGQSFALGTSDFTPVSVVAEKDRYLLAWQSTVDRTTTEAVAAIDRDHHLSIRPISEARGTLRGISLASSSERRVLASSINRRDIGGSADVFLRSLSPALEATDPHPVTATAAMQTSPGIAAGANGYAVSWGETTPDPSTHVYVRRFSEAGAPQDATPIAAFDQPDTTTTFPPMPTILSNGETYLVGWPTPDGFVVRRLAARTGAWIDPQPVPLEMNGGVLLATNGVDAVALSDGSLRLTARRINLTGPPLTSPVVPLKTTAGLAAQGAAIASNGTDYLIAWTEGPICLTPCGVSALPLYALRLRADATAIDAAPLPLNDQKDFPFHVAIVSAAGRYLVTWSSAGGGPRGVRVSSEGAVLDRDRLGGGVLLEPSAGAFDGASVIPSRLDNRFLVLVRHDVFDSNFSVTTSRLDAVTIDPNAELTTFATLPRSPLLSGQLRLLALAPRGSTAAMAYSRVEGGEAGGVERVFLRLLLESRRLRAVGR